jgi:hypothetical protein
MLARAVEIKVEEETSRSFPGLKTEYRLFKMYAEVDGLNRERTGMRFTTAEKGRWDGSRVHVWEWQLVRDEDVKIKHDRPAKVLSR